MKEWTTILQVCKRWRGEAMALATIVKTEGSSYRRSGARVLVRANGETVGGVSGGCLERDVIAHAQKVIATGATILLSYDTTAEEDVVFGVGLGCKGLIEILVEPISRADSMLRRVEEVFETGEAAVIPTVFRSPDETKIGKRLDAVGMPEALEALRSRRSVSKILGDNEIFFEVIQAPIRLFIFGAGFDAIPLARMAKEIGLQVTVVDRRPAYATPERFPEADAIEVLEASEIDRLGIPERSAAVVMGHHYLTDRDFLRALLPRPMRYLGLMGPRRRAEKMLKELREEGLVCGDDLLAKLHNPIGLDIGAEGPEQIALAVLSEINAVYAGHAGGMLREKKGPIHAPRTEP